MALRQQQPIVAGVFHQPSASSHKPSLQAGQRPVRNPARQLQVLPRVSLVVSDQAQPQPPFISTGTGGS
jgi:hypothetical protein